MKKLLSILVGVTLVSGIFVGCSKPSEPTPTTPEAKTEADADVAKTENITLKIGASPTPHAEILKAATETLATQGITLEIVEFTDYIQPNLALENGELDANYFQHQPYLTDFNANNGTKIVSIGNVHYEPMGIYPGKTTDLASIPDGAKIAVPNDTTNEARALLLLEANGLIKIKPEAGLSATKLDIIENTHNYEILEIEAAQLARSIAEVDVSVINGNYALQAGFDVATDSLVKEEKDSLAATTYANIIAAREGDEKRPELIALMEALKSDAVKTYITDTYKGSVESIAE